MSNLCIDKRKIGPLDSGIRKIQFCDSIHNFFQKCVDFYLFIYFFAAA